MSDADDNPDYCHLKCSRPALGEPMSNNYFDTFITVAEDSKTTEAKIPEPRGGKRTVAMMQYEMLSDSFVYTQEDVLFDVWLARQGDLGKFEVGSLSSDEKASMREEFFSKSQACLRSSALTKTHGWGVIFDKDGRAALCAIESKEYGKHAADPNIKVLKALRSKRA